MVIALGFLIGAIAAVGEGCLAFYGLPVLGRALQGEGLLSLTLILFLTFVLGLVVSGWPRFAPAAFLRNGSGGTLVGSSVVTAAVCTAILGEPNIPFDALRAMIPVGMLVGLFGMWCGCKPNLVSPRALPESPSRPEPPAP